MSTQMPINVLIICPDPQAYTSRLAAAFPQVKFSGVAALECTQALDPLGEADAVFPHRPALHAECLPRAQKLKWVPALLTAPDPLAPLLPRHPRLLPHPPRLPH